MLAEASDGHSRGSILTKAIGKEILKTYTQKLKKYEKVITDSNSCKG